MIRPVGKRILIKPVETKHGNLIVTGVKPTQHIIVEVGDEVTKVKKDDVIYLDKFHGAEIIHESIKYLVIEENMILAKLD